MVNIITIAFVHAILFIAAVRLMMRTDLDADELTLDDDCSASEEPETAKPLTASERRRARLRAQQEMPEQ